jgi:hypothetical protein
MRRDKTQNWACGPVQWDFLERVLPEGGEGMLQCDVLPNFHKDGRG